MFGLGAVFLLISPQLRLSVYADLESGINGMEAYSPYSYIGAGVAVLIARESLSIAAHKRAE
jgi:hypothetical protein